MAIFVLVNAINLKGNQMRVTTRSVYRIVSVIVLLVLTLGVGYTQGWAGEEVPVSIAAEGPISGGASELVVTDIQNDGVQSQQIRIDYVSLSPDKLDPQVKLALEEAVNRWTGMLPKNDTVSLVDLRLEDSWALGTVMYFDPETIDVTQSETGSDYIETVALIKQESGVWYGAISNNVTYLDIVDKIPFKVKPDETKKQIKMAYYRIHIAKKESLDSPVANEGVTAPSSPTAQAYYGYQLPWPATDSYHLHSGWHPCADGSTITTCLDFGPGQSANESEVLTVAGGTVDNVCKVSNNAAWVFITTEGSSEQFQYIHLDASSMTNANIAQGDWVDQGQLLGTLYNGATSSCGRSTGTHLHLKFPQVPIRMDGKEFTWETIPDLTSSQCPPRPVFNSTNPPAWTLDLSGQTNKTCTIKGKVTNWKTERGLGNVTVAANTNLILSADSDKCLSGESCTPDNAAHRINSEFGFSFKRFSLVVKSTGKLYIENGAKIW